MEDPTRREGAGRRFTDQEYFHEHWTDTVFVKKVEARERW
jgi:hypothetical protein